MGARYSFKPANESDWALLYDSDHSSEAGFLQGADVRNGTLTIGRMDDIVGGEQPTHRFYEAGTHTITLTLTDPTQLNGVASTNLVLLYNDPPIANGGPDQMGTEAGAEGGVWWFNFDATASSDDNGIYRYEWDWSYDTNTGFEASGYTNPTARYAFSTENEGTNIVAVRIIDQAGQMTIDTIEVVLIIDSLPPEADPGGPYTVEWGWPLTLDGGASTDDFAIARFVWDFGDGNTGEGQNPVHIYRAFTNFNVSLVVYDNGDQPSTANVTTVTVVTGTPPTAVAGGPG
ncbi:MAG: PKD domain-containing protein [Verrucomicrobiota bacterium]